MLRSLVVTALALAAGCTCGEPAEVPAPSAPSEQQAADLGERADKPDGKKGRGAKARPPVLREVEVVLPLADFAPDQLAALRGIVEQVVAEADSEGTVDLQAPEAWKCRAARLVPTDADGVTGAIWQRHADEDCDGEVEAWWSEAIRTGETRPADRDDLGQLDLVHAGAVRLFTDGGWSDSYATWYARADDKADGAFPHDESWFAQGLPDDVKAHTGPAIRSKRWALAKVNVAGENIWVTVDRWRCDVAGKGRKKAPQVGTALRFATHRRQSGHSAKKPTDAVLAGRTRAFADALATALGDHLGGDAPLVDVALETCRGGSR